MRRQLVLREPQDERRFYRSDLVAIQGICGAGSSFDFPQDERKLDFPQGEGDLSLPQGERKPDLSLRQHELQPDSPEGERDLSLPQDERKSRFP